MINKYLVVTLFIVFFYATAANLNVYGQESGAGKSKRSKTEKEQEKELTFAWLDSLVNSRQFVFQAEFGQGSDMVFVVVDSAIGEVQNGNRYNLQGRITDFDVQKNEKRKTMSVNIKMRGEIYTADIFLFLGTFGNGRATVKSEFPGNFYFDGNIYTFEKANIYEGGSILVH